MFYYDKNIICDFQFENSEDEKGPKQINFSIMLSKINKLCNNSQVEVIIGKVLDWSIETDENILQILCDLDLEHVAAKYMFTYP